MRLPHRLPHLEGWRGRIVRGVYLLLLVLVLALFAGLATALLKDVRQNFAATNALGFRTFTNAAAVHFVGHVDAEAHRHGLRAKDTIIAVGTRRLSANADEFEVGERIAATPGDRVTLTVRSEAGIVRRVVLPRDPNPWWRPDPTSSLPLWLYASAQLWLSGGYQLLLIVASFMLFRRRGRDPEAMLFAFAQLLICLQPMWWWPNAPIPDTVLSAGFVTGWFVAFIAICGFPDGRFTTRWAGIVVVALLLIMLPIWGVPLGLLPSAGVRPAFDATLNLAALLLAFGTVVAVVLRFRGTPAGPERQQIKWAVGGFCITTIGMGTLVLFSLMRVESKGNGALLYLTEAAAILAAQAGLPLGLLVSLLRYRLYDAEAAMSRSTVYAALTVSLLAIFAGSEKVIETLGERYFGGEFGALAGGIGAALAAVMIAPLHHRISHWAEKRFQRGLLKLRNGLPLLVGDLRETAPLNEIAQAVLRRSTSAVRAVRGAVIVDGAVVASDGIDPAALSEWQAAWTPPEGEAISADAHDPLLPVRLPLAADGCGLVGWLLLGPRPDGSLFGRDERAALV